MLRFHFQIDGEIEEYVELLNFIDEQCRKRGLTLNQVIALHSLLNGPRIVGTVEQDPPATFAPVPSVTATETVAPAAHTRHDGLAADPIVPEMR